MTVNLEEELLGDSTQFSIETMPFSPSLHKDIFGMNRELVEMDLRFEYALNRLTLEVLEVCSHHRLPLARCSCRTRPSSESVLRMKFGAPNRVFLGRGLGRQ